MKKSWKAWIGAAALLVALPLAAQQTLKEAEHEAGKPEDYDKILKQADKHEILGRLVGSWKADHKVLLYGSPMRESTMKETVDARWMMNQFVDLDYTMAFEGGGTVKGKVIMGYNGALRKFWRLYLSDGDPRGTYSLGVYVRAKNALIFRGMEDDPVSGDSFEKRDVYTFVDKDKILYQMFYTFADGSEVKPIEGYLTRVPEPAANKK